MGPGEVTGVLVLTLEKGSMCAAVLEVAMQRHRERALHRVLKRHGFLGVPLVHRPLA